MANSRYYHCRDPIITTCVVVVKTSLQEKSRIKADARNDSFSRNIRPRGYAHIGGRALHVKIWFVGTVW